MRDEGTYQVPQFKTNNDKPLIYVSYGSLGAPMSISTSA